MDARAIQRQFSDLFELEPIRGYLRAALALGGILGIGFLTFQTHSFWGFIGMSLLLGFWWSSSLILTHDALHYTLTGNKYFDSWFPRLISYPFLWPHGIYSELHKMHHRMLGVDSRDPENPNISLERYKNANSLLRFYYRNLWVIDLFILGGFGFIAKHYIKAFKLRKDFPILQRRLWEDGIATVFIHSSTYLIAIHFDLVQRWVICFLILERIVGAVHQFRSHIEHFGLDNKEGNAFDRQILNSRNIVTNQVGEFFFNHLNHHSVHHAFPSIPFYRIQEASHRLKKIMNINGLALPTANSYLRTGWSLAFQLSPPNPQR